MFLNLRDIGEEENVPHEPGSQVRTFLEVCVS